MAVHLAAPGFDKKRLHMQTLLEPGILCGLVSLFLGPMEGGARPRVDSTIAPM